MIVIAGGVQAAVRIDMTMPKAPEPSKAPGAGQGGVSAWEREAYGEGGRFGSMQAMPSGDPSKDRISVYYTGCGYNVAKLLAAEGRDVSFISAVGEDPLGMAAMEDLRKSGVDISGLQMIDAFRVEENQESMNSEGPDAAGTVANGLIRQSLTSVRVEAKNFLGRRWAGREPVGEGASFADEVHDEIGSPVVGRAAVRDADDVRVADYGGELRLCEELLREGVAGCGVRDVEYLYGVFGPARAVDGPEHRSHSAASDFA